MSLQLLVVTPYPLDTPGGGQRLARGLATSLSTDHGLELLVAAGSGPPGTPATRVTTLVDEIRLPLVVGRAAPWQAPSLNERGRLEGLESLVQAVRPRAILYTPHYSSCARQTQTLAERLGVPFLVWPAIHLDLRRHTDAAARRFYRAAAMVCCLTDVERRWLVDGAGVAAENAVTLGFGGTAIGALQPRAHRSSAEIRLLTVSAFVRHKQLEHQLEALALLRHESALPARLTIAGTLENARLVEQLIRLARRLRIEAWVELRTHCVDDELATLHQAADFFLFTSRSESYGVAVHEAIACGTFPITYPHPVYRDLIDSSGFGIVATQATPRALADAIRTAATTPHDGESSRCRWLADRCWARVSEPLARRLQRFSPTATIK